MKKRIGKKTELLIVLLISFGVVFGILCGTGTLFSGWHFVDDHEYAEYAYMMKYQHMSPWHLMQLWTQADMGIRFRPFYHPVRIMLVYIFGLNLIGFSALRGVVIALTLVFLYYGGKQMGANCFFSAMYALTSMVGYQSAAWWKLGPQESFGTMLFAAGFLLMLKWLAAGSKKYAILSLILFWIMINYKESYIIVLPFIYVYIIYDHNTESKTLKDIWGSRRKLDDCKWYLHIIGLFFISIVAIIIFVIGTDGYSGAGINLTTEIGTYLVAVNHEFTTDLRWYKYCTIFLIAVLLTYWEELKKMWKKMILTLSFLIPQTIIYAQTGFLERYILPASIGFSMFFVIFISNWKILQGKRKKFYAIVLIVMLILNTRAMLVEADYFRYRGESITTMMEEVNAMSGKDKKILSCFSPHEESNITLKYWMLLKGNDRIYYWHQTEQTIDQEFKYDKYPDLTGSNSTMQKIGDMDIVVMYNRNDRDFDHEVNLNLSDFTKVDCGTLTIYVRNNDGINIPDIHVRPAYYYAK